MLNITEKIKDNSKAHLDLQEMRIRQELYLVRQGEKKFMPSICYSLFGKKRKSFYGWFKIIKFSNAYAPNISWCISNNDGNIFGMKSHDSYVMMQHLLLMVMHGYLSGDAQAY